MPASNQTPVVILGAGATKASGGPLTNEILPAAFGAGAATIVESNLPLLERFLIEVFGLAKARANRTKEQFPSLPLLLSLIDTAIDRKEPIAPTWPVATLVPLRRAIEYTFYIVLKRSLETLPANPHRALLDRIKATPDVYPTIISLNYDLVIDNTLLDRSHQYPDYGCDLATEDYVAQKGKQLLLKIHGSLNWLYCAACHRMDVAISEDKLHLVKVFPFDVTLEKKFGGDTPCKTCTAVMESVMITPTYRKDYRNPHISRIWYEAERALREARNVIFIGYSLPEDDVEVIYLLKRGLHGRDPKQITVVEMANDNVRQRYRQLFGEIDWQPLGFQGWLDATPA